MTKSKHIRRGHPDDPKRCTTCKQLLAPSRFYGSGFRLSSSCKECRAKNAPEEHRIWRMKKSEKARETQRLADKARLASKRRETSAARRHRTQHTLCILNELYTAGFGVGELHEHGLSKSNQRNWKMGIRRPTEAGYKSIRDVWRRWQDGEISPGRSRGATHSEKNRDARARTAAELDPGVAD